MLAAGDAMEITTRMSGDVAVVELLGKMTVGHGVREFGDSTREVPD
jgi:hypothetical protein